jgi:hypothetical protein
VIESSGAESSANMQSVSELFIEFDGEQLAVITDVPEIHEFLMEAFAAMLVPSQQRSVGRLEFMRSPTGYSVRGGRGTAYVDPVQYLFESVKDEILYCFTTARTDLMWVHAGGAERDGKAILFAGPSGNGKSTMVTLLCERGWRFLSDDIAPIRMNADEVLPFPQAPRRRIHPGETLAPENIGILLRESIAIDPVQIQRAATPIGGIVFPVFQEGAVAGMERVAAGDAALKLIRDCTNFADHKAAAVSRAVELARTIPVYGLTYSTGRDAQSLLDLRL